MADGYTIQIYVPDGDPDGIRIISDMHWTGLGVVFTRSKLPELGQPADLQRIDAPPGMMKSPFYTSFAKLKSAKKLTDLRQG